MLAWEKNYKFYFTVNIFQPIFQCFMWYLCIFKVSVQTVKNIWIWKRTHSIWTCRRWQIADKNWYNIPFIHFNSTLWWWSSIYAVCLFFKIYEMVPIISRDLCGKWNWYTLNIKWKPPQFIMLLKVMLYLEFLNLDL